MTEQPGLPQEEIDEIMPAGEEKAREAEARAKAARIGQIITDAYSRVKPNVPKPPADPAPES